MWHVELPELAYDVLELDLDHLEPAAYLPPVQASMPDINAYYEQYKPLILDEVIAALKVALERARKKTSRYGIQITPADQIFYYPEDDITILKLKGEYRIDCADEVSGFRFIMVEVLLGSSHYLGMVDIFLAESRLVIKGNLCDTLEDNEKFFIIPLVSLVNLDRMYNVCCEMPDSPVLAKIRHGKTDEWPVIAAEDLACDQRISAALNDSQKMAVKNFVDAKAGLFVLQGPPGTGKTTTIVEMLRQHMKQPGRVLVCAPSNKAVQVLAERSLQAMPQDPLLLVGVVSKISPKVEEIFMDNWVQRYPRKLPGLMSELDVRSQLLPGNMGGKSLLKATDEVDFEKLNQCLHHLQTIFSQIKEVLRVCFRYALLNSELRQQYFDLANKMMSEYIGLLESVQKQAAEQAFPALHAASAVPAVVKPNIAYLQQAISERYAQLYDFILNRLMNEYFPKDNDTLLQQTKILFCTLSVSGRVMLQRQCAKQGSFTSLIMDEAGQAVEAEGLIPFVLAPTVSKVLLAGDTRQLPATTISRSSRHTNFEWSMMWRLIEQNHQIAYPLTVQYRMRPAIQHFPSNRYYEGRLSGHPSILLRRFHSHFISAYGSKSWIDIRGREERHETTFRNQAEAIAIVEIVRAIRERDTTSHIGIISFYSGQIGLIVRQMEAEKRKNQKIGQHNITISTVDGFQGDEKDIIIVSLVRANDSKEIGFLNDFRRLNVAITRAKDGLFVLGNRETFTRTQNNEIKELLDFCVEANKVASLEHLLKEIKGTQSKSSVKAAEKPPALPVVLPIRNVAAKMAAHKAKGSHTKPASASVVYTLEELLARAGRCVERMEYENAIENYNLVLQREPKRFDIYAQLASCYDALENAEQAQLMRDIGESIRAEMAEYQQLQREGKDLPEMRAPVLPPVQEGFVTVGQKQKITDSIRKARVLTDNRQFSEAEKIYLELHDAAPDHAEVLLGLGWCAHKQRKNIEAVRYFELALTFDKSPLGYQGLILSKKHSSDVESALDIACEGVEYFPYSKTLYRLKEELEQQSRSAIAMRQSFYATKVKMAAMPAAAVIPKSVATKAPHTLFFAQATASSAAVPIISASGDKEKLARGLQAARHLSEAGQSADAEKKYRELLQAYPHSAEVLLGLGLSLNRQRENQAAIPYLEQAFSLQQSSLVYQQLVIAYKHVNHIERAMQYVNQGLQAYPGSSGLNALKLKLAKQVQKPRVAVSVPVTAKPAFDFKKMLTEARILCTRGHMSQALVLYQQVLIHAPNHYEVLLGLAWVYNKLADYGQAISFFQRSISVKSNDANPYYGLAVAFKGLEKLEDAKFAISNALQLKPAYPDYRAFKEKLDGLGGTPRFRR